MPGISSLNVLQALENDTNSVEVCSAAAVAQI